MARISKRYPHMQAELGNTEGLTKRQAQVAELMGIGLTNVEIAGRLGISVDTVNCHMDALKDRFYAANRMDLLCQMWMHGILQARAMTTVLVFGLCALSAFPMARANRAQVSGSVRQEMRVTRSGRKELNVLRQTA